MTKSKMIVLWGKENILSSYIEFFLAAKADWKVVSIADKKALDALLLAVETTQPDIVIIHQACPGEPTQLPLQLLFQEHPAIKVITLSFENNAIEVYTKQKFLVKQASDLIAVIENEP